MPVPTRVAENKAKFGINTELALIDWEKNQILPFFKELEKEAKKGINKESLLLLYEKLQKDECIIGKVPADG